MLEKVLEEAQAQSAQYRTQMQEMQDSMKKAAQVVKVSEASCTCRWTCTKLCPPPAGGRGSCRFCCSHVLSEGCPASGTWAT